MDTETEIETPECVCGIEDRISGIAINDYSKVGIITNCDELFYLSSLIGAISGDQFMRTYVDSVIQSICGQNLDVITYEQEYGKPMITYMQENIYGFVAVNELKELDPFQKDEHGNIMVYNMTRYHPDRVFVLARRIAIKGKQQYNDFTINKRTFKLCCYLISCKPWIIYTEPDDSEIIYTIYR